MEKELEQHKTDITTLATGIDWYIIYRSLDNNVCKKKNKIFPIQENKLKNVTFNKVIPFASDEVVKN